MEEVAELSEFYNIDNDVALSKKGDKGAFGRTIRKHKHSMYITARSVMSNEHDIEDAIADTILKAYLNIRSLKEDRYFKAWLLKILVNQCYSKLKKK